MSSYRRRHDPQAGGALMFALIITAVILLVGSYAMYVSLAGRRAATRNLHGKAAFLCADAALAQGKAVASTNWSSWNTVLAKGPPAWTGGPGWYPTSDGIVGICQTDAAYDIRTTIRDDVDELSGANDPLRDNNLQIIVESRAERAGVVLARVSAFVRGPSSGMMGDYGNQYKEGAGKSGNVRP